MSKVDLAIDDYEESSGRKGDVAHYLQTGIVQSIPLRRTCPTQNKRPCTQKKVRDKLEESVYHVIEVKDGTPVSKDVIKAAANIQSLRASYNQAYRAIGRAVANGPREKHQASFGLIMSYLKHFQLRNEDSTVKAESDADQRLRRLGICPGIVRRSLQHVMPVLSLDGAHLLSKWKGTLHIASVQTTCSNIYPVSFAIMKDGEDAEGWKWFLELLVQAIPLLKMQHPDNRCRQKGLIQALQQVFPDNHHCFCSVHIARNVEKEVGKQVAKHVHALSATFSKRESDELMAKLTVNAISARGKKYFEGISANQWRSTAWVDDPTLPPRFGIVTTNMSESVNSLVGDARDGSWLECTNDIVRKMLNRICSLREENYIDAVAYYRLFETQTLQYIMGNHVSEHYKYETVNELLKENIVPVSLDILDQDGVTLPPNRTIRSSGRPRKKKDQETISFRP
ncbi:MULE transposase domain containing protein [Nitzschia inconspicua]|uniref:MULE transposase domain containing protein n=1 Tax=Nitzschia inconspicua TaxID=303405 RepID=A0A9K3M651_9STRA|nr:MULE transposase domain containing protein [Nitzschia inconspicua]